MTDTDRDTLMRMAAFEHVRRLGEVHDHLIGIDPDYRLHVSRRLLDQNDGPMLEALKQLNGESLHLPRRVKDRPDRDRLAMRFERFKAVA
jgi:putative restriction endonuclease